MGVVARSVTVHANFIRNLKENGARTPIRSRTNPRNKTPLRPQKKPQVNRKHTDNLSVEQGNINMVLSPQLRYLFNQSITINSTAFEDIDPKSKELTFVGSKTETTLLHFAKDLGWENWEETHESAKIMQMTPFSSERKAMGVVVRLQSGRYRLFLEGASEILTKKCKRHVVVSRNPDRSQNVDSEVETKAVHEVTRDNISWTNIFQALRTIALCHRDLESCPPPRRYSLPVCR